MSSVSLYDQFLLESYGRVVATPCPAVPGSGNPHRSKPDHVVMPQPSLGNQNPPSRSIQANHHEEYDA
jgi:hypothetical protein